MGNRRGVSSILGITEIDTSTVGGRIKEQRKKAGLTQDQLAELLVLEDKASVSNYERNRRIPPTEQVMQLAQIFGTTSDYILFGSEETTAPVENSKKMMEAEEILKRLESSGRLDAAISILMTLEQLG